MQLPWNRNNTAVLNQLSAIERTLATMSSMDAEIQAATATLVANNATLTGLVNQVLADLANGGTVQPSTLAALQAAVGDDTTEVGDLNTGVNPPATPPAS